MFRIWFAVGLLALAAPAAAEEISSPRYTMTPINGGVLRLDTLTGAVARCVETAGAWSCRALPDDALALQDEIDRLAEENARLRAGADGSAAESPVVTFKLPSDAEVDKAMSLVERVLKRFKSIVEGLREDEKGTAL